MASINKAILIGNLGQDPTTRFLPDGKAVCNFSIATTETWKDKNSGDKKEATEWHRISAFGKLAEVCGEYLRKGSSVYIEGRIQTRKYDKDGQTYYTTEIIADQMKMLGSKPDSRERGDDTAPPRKEAKPAATPAVGRSGSFDDMESDIPF